jgi:nucleoside-diphosphate-sugar epimerase
MSMMEFTRAIVKELGKKTRVFPISPFGVRIADGFIAMLDILRLNPGIRRPSQMNIDKPCSHEKIKQAMGWEPQFTLDKSIRDSIIDGN